MPWSDRATAIEPDGSVCRPRQDGSQSQAAPGRETLSAFRAPVAPDYALASSIGWKAR